MVLFCDDVFSCVITLLVRTDLAKIGLWRVHMIEKFSLVGVDGNAFSIMAYVKTVMREAGFSKEERSAYIENCMRGDYDRLLILSDEMIDRCNDALCLDAE